MLDDCIFRTMQIQTTGTTQNSPISASYMRQVKMEKTKDPPTYEGEVLSAIAFDFSNKDHEESTRKIKRRLRDKKLGPYDQKRINSIRAFKDDVQQELHKYNKSPFYCLSHGKYADMQDWDFDALMQYMKSKHQDVSEEAIGGFLPYAIYLYYLR